MIAWRIRFLQLFFLIFALAVLGRLFFWQVLNYSELSARANSQHLTTISIEADRGKILSSDGEVLVSNQNKYLFFGLINEIKKSTLEDVSYDTIVKGYVEKISPVLLTEKINTQKEPEKLTEIEKKTFEDEIKASLEKSLKTENVVWVALARKISESSKKAIEALKLKGLGFENQSARFYPNGNLASQVLGFVGFDSEGNDKGYGGLEGFYDEQLRGRVGRLTEEVDAQGHPILSGVQFGANPSDGLDIVSTIDRTVQFTLEKHLSEGIKKYNAKLGSGIVLEAKTGAILAMANVPNFDPNKWFSFPQEELRNSAISDTYEPGSTFKIITAAAGLDTGVISTETICPCEGPVKVGGYEITTFNKKYHPNSTVGDILRNSDNVGASFIGEKIGKDKFIEYIKKFGFGSQLGIDLQGEETGLLKKSSDWYPIDLVTTSFGQGISVTALQIASAASVIVNEGKLMKPFVVNKIEGEEKTVENKPTQIRQVIKPEIAATIKELLFQGVERSNARRNYKIGLRVGGKTGTAQIPIAGHYDPNKTVASFVGFGPIEKPKFIAIIRYYEPFPIHGDETALPTFFRLTNDLYSYWGIPIN